MRKKYLVIILMSVALISIILGIIFINRISRDNSNDSLSAANSSQNPADISNVDDEPYPSGETPASNDTNVPQPPPTNITSSRPLVYTGYGHAQSAPLGLDQNTVTTCTSAPDTNCYITFTRVNDNKSITFDTQKTNSQGVTSWEWTGLKLGTGKWFVVATVGNNISDEETIYVE